MSILDGINSPKDIKGLNNLQLSQLCDEIREFLIQSISKTGGHLASNLGVVELTIALHRVFNMPQDKIIWDVGHQAYVHKILTGRKEQFPTLKKYQGMSGFPKPNESEYDIFAAGHSSTSISAALGIARARDLKNEKCSVIAVIGDGALTGGMAFEALNDAGMSKSNIIVVLNDNEMSISPNVGGLSTYLSKIRTEPAYITIRDDIENIVKRIPSIGNNLYKSAKNLKESIKTLVLHGMLFEQLGFTYLGPIDGHNIENIIEVLQRARNIKGPVLIHAVTKKGKGYSFAEKDPDIFHGVGAFDIETGEKKSSSIIDYSKVFGEEIVNEAFTNDKIVAITAAMPTGTGLEKFSKQFPNRFFDVGIAEQHGVTLAAGLAISGLKPVVAIYSTFLQRAYDQIVHDVCMQNLPVMFAIDRAGIVGEDGETHQGVLDISYLRGIPNITILAPKDMNEFRMMLKWCFKFNAPVAIRYPRGKDSGIKFYKYEDISNGKWEFLKEGSRVAILGTGKMVQTAFAVSERLYANNINAAVVNCRFIKPMDRIALNSIFKNYDIIFTLEDNYVSGGFGSGVLEYASKVNYNGKIELLGYPDEFIPHGSTGILYKKYALDVDGVYDTILKNI
ncbi:MAG: dxs [Clostridiales bacterium]|nr:dxs [Clostridiales bacterium]